MIGRASRLLLPLLLAGVLLGSAWMVLGASAESPGAAPAAPSLGLTATVSLQEITRGLSMPVYLTHAGDGSGRLFVVEQIGQIRIIKNGALLATPFLDITGLVQCCVEQGLLSVAFDPDYESNGTFYVNYTAQVGGGDTVVARYVVSNPASDAPSILTATALLTIDQPQANHNGGQLQFGPFDNYLYIGMGDGGGGGDSGSGHAPEGNGQSPGALLGKLLRIHVRGVPTYTIPASNPFTQTAGYRPEIWALGLRNPWRFSFDRLTGDMYIGDVGQNCYEEVSYQPAGVGGLNYGWRIMEGFRAFNTGNFNDCSGALITPVTLTLPITAYGRSVGSTVVGGYVYRGSAYPWLHGVYFFGDYGSGRLWAMEQVSPGVWQSLQKLSTGFNISSFGEDEAGELYALDYSNGRVYRLTSAAPPDFSQSAKTVSHPAPASGSVVTYTVAVRNAGGAVAQTSRLTDVLPAGVAYKPGTLAATLGSVDASSAPTLRWNGVLSNTPVVTVTFAVTVTQVATTAITNIVTIAPGATAPFTRSAAFVVNGQRVYLPIVQKNH